MKPIEIYRRTPERDQILHPHRSHVPSAVVRPYPEDTPRRKTGTEAEPGYSGEFKVSVYNVVRNSEEEENPGEITSLELSVCNGLYEGYDNAYPYAGWVMLIGNRVYHVPALGRSSYIKGETSLRLSNFCIWLRVVFGSRVATEYIFTDEDEQPKNKSEVYMSVYHLLAIVRDGKVFQAQYGAIYITDRYYDVDEADTE